jgi:Fe-S-cluster containining protein
MATYLPRGNGKLVQIVNAAFDDASARSGKFLACRPGCTQCCVGVFAISQLDAARLRHGLDDAEKSDPKKAARIKRRVRASRKRLERGFPGDSASGVLEESDEALDIFDDFANDEPCPVLDPKTGRCDLYESRPLLCRAFGVPFRVEEGLGHCELCFKGATVKQIAECEMTIDPDDLETKLLETLARRTGKIGRTIVAFAFE